MCPLSGAADVARTECDVNGVGAKRQRPRKDEMVIPPLF